jgi:hypothetical protein
MEIRMKPKKGDSFKHEDARVEAIIEVYKDSRFGWVADIGKVRATYLVADLEQGAHGLWHVKPGVDHSHES